MPISRAELERAKIPVELRITDFLRRNATNAYTAAEIWSAVGGLGDASSALYAMLVGEEKLREELKPYHEALERLIAEGKVQAYDHKDMKYFAIGKVR